MDKEKIIKLLKTEGLDVAEDVAVQAVKAVFQLLRILMPEVSKGAGLLIGPMLSIIEPHILSALDGIDGEDDPEY